MSERRVWSIDSLFDAAMEQPADARTAFVRSACGEDEALAREVLSLIEAHVRAEGFLNRSAIDQDASLASLADPNLNQCIGPYRILRLIAVGGMGRVYLAERIDGAFTRQVAIKVIRQDIGTSEIIRRFHHERNVLAQLDHPNIARLLDGGSTDDGLPYLVMEYVEGRSITEYCDQHRLSVDERLVLFETVCACVQAAHQSLVIHRDLKPSNILVTNDGVIKLLDFGIAKVLSSVQQEDALTVTRERRLTPAYASPEQVRGQAVTTASDVFSLGVILYELLTGLRPHTPKSQSAADMERAICDEPPAHPSVAILQSNATTAASDRSTESRTLQQISAARSIDASKLCRLLRGDLEIIVLMALRKEPHRRYATVQQLADDIKRYRASLPVVARPDTLRYRIHKFMSRNRAGVAAAIIFLGVLIGATVVSTTLFFETARERDRAQLAEQRADRRFQEVRELANVMLFDVYDGIRELPGSTRPGKAIVATAHQYLQGLMSETIDDAELLYDIASAYRRLGEIQGGLEGSPGLGDVTGALESLQAGYAIVEQLLNVNPHADAYKLTGAAILLGMGSCYSEMSRLDEAEDALRRGMALRATVQSTEQQRTHPESHIFIAELAKLRLRHGEYEKAEHLYSQHVEATLDLLEQYPADAKVQYQTGIAKMMLGEHLLNQRDLDQARPLLERAAVHLNNALQQQPANRNYRRLRLNTLWLIGQAMLQDGDPTEAIAFLEDLTDEQYELMASDPLDRSIIRDIATSHRYLGEFLVTLAQVEEGLIHYEKAVAMREQLVALDETSVKQRRDLAAAIDMQATALWRLGQFDEAMHLHIKAREVFVRLAEDHPNEVDLRRSIAVSDFNLGELHAGLGRDEQTSPANQLQHFQNAALHYQRALDVMMSIRDAGLLSGGDQAVIPMLEQRLAQLGEINGDSPHY